MLNLLDITIIEDFNENVYRNNNRVDLEKYKTFKELYIHYMIIGKRIGYEYKVESYEIGEIIKCKYGANNIFIDVTNLISNEMIGIQYNSIFTDPIYGVAKILRIEHSNGILELRENSSFVLQIT